MKAICGGGILKVLSDKVKEGVEVRFMYDGTCELSLLPHSYPKKLEKLGIQCKVFAPIRPFLSTHYNYRDHRKILIVDGRIAITGGINLADEYINRKEVYGHWKDTAIMIQGQAVESFTLMFLQMWNINKGKRSYINEFYKSQPLEKKEKGYVLPFGDSPLDNYKVGQMVYMDIINQAKDYVYIMTPYLILDGEMVTSLKFAAQRGIDVKIIMPHIPDKR
jgi:cardiolipin synthase